MNSDGKDCSLTGPRRPPDSLKLIVAEWNKCVVVVQQKAALCVHGLSYLLLEIESGMPPASLKSICAGLRNRNMFLVKNKRDSC